MSENKDAFFKNIVVVIIGALICSLLWGSAFPCIKIGYDLFDIAADDYATQILFAGVRFIIAGIMAVILGSIINKQLLVPHKNSIKMVVHLSSFQTIGQYIFFYIGLAHTLGVRGSIMEGTNSFIAILVACLIFKTEQLTIKKVIGCLLGFSGILLINMGGSKDGGGNYLLGDLLVFASVVCYAFSSVYLKRYSQYENTVVLSSYQFVLGGIVMTIIGIILGGSFSIITLKGMAMLFYLAFISAVAYSLWGILLTYNPISRVAIFGFMNPMFGFILSAVLLHERAGLFTSIFAIALICTGIFIVNYEKKTKKVSD